jgi:hypothetical protein
MVLLGLFNGNTVPISVLKRSAVDFSDEKSIWRMYFLGGPYGGFRYAQRKSKIFRTRWIQVNPYGEHTAKKHTENGVLFAGDP